MGSRKWSKVELFEIKGYFSQAKVICKSWNLVKKHF